MLRQPVFFGTTWIHLDGTLFPEEPEVAKAGTAAEHGHRMKEGFMGQRVKAGTLLGLALIMPPRGKEKTT